MVSDLTKLKSHLPCITCLLTYSLFCPSLNQTNPIHSRSTPYPSDIGKAFGCPVFHVNGDDPLAASAAVETAVEYRHEWGGDVIIHVVCYRRWGHNELDQPAFTQPKLYRSISRHPTTLNIFQKRLIDEKSLSKEEADEIRAFVMDSYEKDFEASKTYVRKDTDWLSSKWVGFKGPTQQSRKFRDLNLLQLF